MKESSNLKAKSSIYLMGFTCPLQAQFCIVQKIVTDVRLLTCTTPAKFRTHLHFLEPCEHEHACIMCIHPPLCAYDKIILCIVKS
ncbi:hypothetical protein EB796_006091 [Bugula neritina]|uniref:Uncharacterized protein n=1 Tax=Bugula neritina TaxID=10212 RepID=A0A7J7KBL1_BUGNE|nr:hypothetical protein EB796_006091 [Bugula neritina]